MVVSEPPTVTAKLAPVFGVGNINNATCNDVAPVLATATVIVSDVGIIRVRLVKSLVVDQELYNPVFPLSHQAP
jgi:hypothetical protein